MASPMSTLTPATAPPRPDGPRGSAALRRRPAPRHAAARTTAWPVRPAWRWLVRLLFATPLAVLAARVYGHGFGDSANALLAHRADAIRWGSGDLSFVGHVYPPLPTVIAAILPSGTALGIAGAVGAGTMLEVVGARLARSGYPLWAVLVVVACFGASPGFALTATTNLAAFLALTFVALALEGFLRFAFHGYTHAGFTAGLMIGLATLCDPIAIVFAVGFAIAAPLIAGHRFSGSPAAGRATAAVLLFPTAAGLAGWTFLCWRFADGPFQWLHAVAPAIWTRRGIGSALQQSMTPVALTPVYLLAIVLLLARRHLVAALGICVPLACVAAGVAIGLPCPPATVAVVLGVVGLTSLPRRPRALMVGVVVAVAVAGLAAKWAYPASPALQTWLHALR